MNLPRPRVLSFQTSIGGATLLLFFVSAANGAAPETSGSAAIASQPGDFALKVEPGVAFPLTAPQSELFKTGGSQTIKALWTLTPALDLGPSITYMMVPTEAAGGEAGTALAFGASLRIKRPRHLPDGDTFRALSPWADLDALYVRTGDLNRPGLALAAGVAAPVGKTRAFWIGPFVRYLHIIQAERAGFDSHDAKVLSVGLSLEGGPAVEHEPEVVADAEVRTVNKEVFVCADGDKDGIPDNVDRCPEVVGTMEFWGCPAYKKIVVQRDKLELKERLYFAWNQATLQEASFPVLDEVVQALKDNKGFRVQVEGHTSSEGGEGHNQTLSEQRATAVLDYLVAHGIEKERLVSKGFASSVPADSNETSAGRENNRRVIFVVNFIILNEGKK